MAWRVLMVGEVADWLEELADGDPKLAARVIAAVGVLEQKGPTLGRPLVDRIEGSSVQNLKELRPSSNVKDAVRVLFAFDPQRQAVLLVAGNKAGRWSEWYDEAIPLAEERFEAWINGYSVEEW